MSAWLKIFVFIWKLFVEKQIAEIFVNLIFSFLHIFSVIVDLLSEFDYSIATIFLWDAHE